MFNKKAIKRGLVGALLVLGLGIAQGCSGDIMSPANTDDSNCVWINGVKYCEPDGG